MDQHSNWCHKLLAVATKVLFSLHELLLAPQPTMEFFAMLHDRDLKGDLMYGNFLSVFKIVENYLLPAGKSRKANVKQGDTYSPPHKTAAEGVGCLGIMTHLCFPSAVFLQQLCPLHQYTCNCGYKTFLFVAFHSPACYGVLCWASRLHSEKIS